MKNKLSLIAFVAAALAITFAILAVRSHWISVGEQRVQVLWDAQISELATATIKHEIELFDNYLKEESQLREENERITQDDFERSKPMQDRIDELVAANDSLQRTNAQQRARIRKLSANATNASTCPTPDEAAFAAGELLAKCSAEYTRVASDADRLSNQVIGLQQYASMCQRPSKDGGKR